MSSLARLLHPVESNAAAREAASIALCRSRALTGRRWTDPRDQRTWEVTACHVRGTPTRGPRETPLPDAGSPALCFDSAATPRRGHSVPCCSHLEGRLEDLDDQAVALCLDAARVGGFLWLDDRTGEVWWVRAEDDALKLRGRAREVEIRPAPPFEPADLDDGALRSLLEGSRPARRRGDERRRGLKASA